MFKNKHSDFSVEIKEANNLYLSRGYRDRANAQDQITPIEEEILCCLYSQELYGLQIVEAFNEVSQGKRRISIGTLYPVLARLEKKGFLSSRMSSQPIRSKGGARRKYFKITEKGTYALSNAEAFRRKLTKWEPSFI